MNLWSYTIHVQHNAHIITFLKAFPFPGTPAFLWQLYSALEKRFIYSHFNPFNVNTPRVRGFIQKRFHVLRDAFALAEYFVKRPLAHYVPQGRLCQQSGGMMGVFHIGYGDGRIGHAVINHSVHRNRHAVLGEHLKKFRGLEVILSYNCKITVWCAVQFELFNKWN